MVDIKHQCNKCSTYKDHSNFYVRENGRLRNECKECLTKIRLSKKEYIAARKKEWQLKNKEYLKQYDKNFYTINKNSRNKKNNEYIISRMRNDLNFKLRRLLRTRLNAAIKNNLKIGSAIDDLGCTIDELKKYLESLFKPGMTWDNYGKEWQIDHKEALCKFDLTNRQQFLTACNYKNLQPLWKSEHLLKTIEDRKHAKDLGDTGHSRNV